MLTGSGVFLFLTGAGQIHAENNRGLTLTARTSGPYVGIAIFQDPSDTMPWDTRNNFLLDVKGVIYMPGVDVDIANALTFVNNGCNLFIAKSLNIRNGNGDMSSTGCASAFAGAAFLSVSLAE
jgi:hypothetical protein